MLDPDRKIDECIGTLVSELCVGSHASEAIPFLVGLDDVLIDIKKGLRPPLTMHRVALGDGSSAANVFSLEVSLSDTVDRLQILVRDESELASLEQNILQQRNELTLANEELALAKQRAEDALKEKSSFLANISHDLKTPLQVIIGNAEILRGGVSEKEQEGFLQDVLDNGNFLLALITDLLDASALEADQLSLTEEVIDISALLERTLSMARQMPNGDERHFELSIDDQGQAIMADPMRLQRLLLNVVSNAVKFTDVGGRIVVRAGREEAGEFVIEVEDDGCGIEPELMQRVFEPFTMGGLSEGSGLGLHISKGLANLHGADLVISSEAGIGTKAKLCLPRSRVVNQPT